MHPLWLVKLGGSLLSGRGPEPWLDAVLAADGPARLIVPGGGPFADAIRALERTLGLGRLSCHRMAILAMQQYAIHLQELRSALRFVATLAEIATLRAEGAAGLWLPWQLVGLDPLIEASWDVTSDSLALHLARRTEAAGLVLVKSAPVPDRPTSTVTLAASGLVDPAMPRLMTGAQFPVRLLGPGQEGELARALLGGEVGCHVVG